MAWETVAAALLAIAVLVLVLQPLVAGQPVRSAAAPVPSRSDVDPEDTARGVALAALKEIEFDRETGKLSDDDYAFLKAKYSAAAVAALREDDAAASNDLEAIIAARVRALRAPATSAAAPACAACGPRPEPDAIYCSECGGRLAAPAGCPECGAALPADSRFCERCGSRVAA